MSASYMTSDGMWIIRFSNKNGEHIEVGHGVSGYVNIVHGDVKVRLEDEDAELLWKHIGRTLHKKYAFDNA